MNSSAASQARPLGRNVPPDWKHVEKFPLSALAPELQPKHVPVVVGVNWYEAFDSPVLGADGIYRVPALNLGQVRGGHSFCFEPVVQADQPGGEQDSATWWDFYDQASEGACVGFGLSRALTLLYRRQFDAFWLYDDARRREGAFPDGEGTLVRSGGEALKAWGAHFLDSAGVIAREPWRENAPGREILAYRWITTVEEFRAALGYPTTAAEFDFLNSWGKSGYPERVRMPDTVVAQLLSEEGEALVFTEK
jgi:hypothetical protein